MELNLTLPSRKPQNYRQNEQIMDFSPLTQFWLILVMLEGNSLVLLNRLKWLPSSILHISGKKENICRLFRNICNFLFQNSTTVSSLWPSSITLLKFIKLKMQHFISWVSLSTTVFTVSDLNASRQAFAKQALIASGQESEIFSFTPVGPKNPIQNYAYSKSLFSCWSWEFYFHQFKHHLRMTYVTDGVQMQRSMHRASYRIIYRIRS